MTASARASAACGSSVFVEPRKLCGQGWLGRIAEHGDRSSEGGADGWQPTQTCAYRPADALGAQLAGQASVLAARRDAPPLELAEELHGARTGCRRSSGGMR